MLVCGVALLCSLTQCGERDISTHSFRNGGRDRSQLLGISCSLRYFVSPVSIIVVLDDFLAIVPQNSTSACSDDRTHMELLARLAQRCGPRVHLLAPSFPDSNFPILASSDNNLSIPIHSQQPFSEDFPTIIELSRLLPLLRHLLRGEQGVFRRSDIPYLDRTGVSRCCEGELR